MDVLVEKSSLFNLINLYLSKTLQLSRTVLYLVSFSFDLHWGENEATADKMSGVANTFRRFETEIKLNVLFFLFFFFFYLIIFPFLQVSPAFDTLDWCLTNQGRLPCLSEGLVDSVDWIWLPNHCIPPLCVMIEIAPVWWDSPYHEDLYDGVNPIYTG